MKIITERQEQFNRVKYPNIERMKSGIHSYGKICSIEMRGDSLKERYFWLIMVVIVIAWIGNYTYLHSKQLDEPIILSHYYDQSMEEYTRVRVFYLTNKNHQELNYADFRGVTAYPNLGGGFEFFNENEKPRHEQEFRHHFLKSTTLDIREDLLGLQKGSGDRWTAEDIIAYFNQGAGNSPHVVADFGGIAVQAGYPGKQVFRFQVSGSSNKNRTYSVNEVLEDLTVEEIRLPYEDQIGKFIDIKVARNISYSHSGERRNWADVSGEPLEEIEFPLKLKKGDSLSISSQVNDELKSYVDVALKVKGKTATGETFESPIRIDSRPIFSQEDIDRIVAEHKGGKR